jgi:hypothetical protein
MRFDGKEVNLTTYPLFDAMLNGAGTSALKEGINLFAQDTVGDPYLTNMSVQGQIPSGGVYLLDGMQGLAYFRSLADTEFATAYGSGSNQVPAFGANVTATPARMLDCYSMLAYGCNLTLFIARVPQLIVPWYALPAAGGPFGQSTVQGASIVTNGMPQFGATWKLVEPLIISSLQNFKIVANFGEFSSDSKAGQFTGSGQVGAINGISTLQFLNSADGIKVAGVKLSGSQTFDIQ